MNRTKQLTLGLTVAALLLAVSHWAAAQAVDSPTNAAASVEASTSDSSPFIRVRRDELVAIGHDVELPEGSEARDVVVVGGNAIIRGKVDECVVVVGGTADVRGCRMGYGGGHG